MQTSRTEVLRQVSRLGRLLGILLALAGFAAARTFVPAGHAMQVPTVTVSVPSLPAPVPSTPTVTVAPPPVPTPTVTTPTVTTPPVPVPTPTTPPSAPTPPPVQLPPAPAPVVTVPVTTAGPALPPATTAGTATASAPRSSPAPSPGAAPATGGSSGGTPSSSGSSAGAGGVTGSSPVPTGDRPKGTTMPRGLAARTLKTKSRVSVRLRFALPAAGRLFLIVRGPVPSCRVAGVIPIRGRKGVNTLYFAGRVHGRRLAPGLYQLSLSSTRRPQPAAPATAVRVVSARRAVPVAKPARLPSCAVAQAYFDDGTRRILVIETKQQRPTATLAAVPRAPLQPPLSGGISDGEDEEVGGLLPDPGSVGDGSAEGGVEAFAAIAVLVIVATLLLGMVALVARFLRGSWNP